MDFSDGLAVAAIVLAVLAIVSEIAFFVVQTDRATKSQREISDYVGRMREVLGKIEGLTTGTREQLQDQFRWLLQAAVGQERASVAQELGDRVAALEGGLASLNAGASADAGEQTDKVMGELKREVEALARDIETLGESARRQPPSPAPRRSETPFLDEALQREAYRRWLLGPRGPIGLALQPEQVQPGGRVHITQQGWIPAGDFETLHLTVASPDGREWSARILQDLRGYGGRRGLIFPDEFDGASTVVNGTYRVSAQRVSLDGSPIGEPVVAHFFVQPAEAELQT